MSSSDPKPGSKPGPWPPAPESAAMPPSSWAKKTGFRPKFSGETTSADSGQISLPVRAKQQENQPDLEAGQARLRPPPVPVAANGEIDKDKKEKPPPPPPLPPQPSGGSVAVPVKRRRDSDGGRSNGGADGANGSGPDPVRRPARIVETVEVLPQSMDDDLVARNLHMKYGLRDTPGLGEIKDLIICLIVTL